MEGERKKIEVDFQHMSASQPSYTEAFSLYQAVHDEFYTNYTPPSPPLTHLHYNAPLEADYRFSLYDPSDSMLVMEIEEEDTPEKKSEDACFLGGGFEAPVWRDVQPKDMTVRPASGGTAHWTKCVVYTGTREVAPEPPYVFARVLKRSMYTPDEKVSVPSFGSPVGFALMDLPGIEHAIRPHHLYRQSLHPFVQSGNLRGDVRRARPWFP